MINSAQETLDLRRWGFSPHFTLLIPAFALLFRPRVLTVTLQPTTERSPTKEWRRTAIQSVASVYSLSPVTFSAQNHSTSELLRTLSRMAASKPTSWLFMRSYFLYHLAILGDLS
jgi:hypothetical protein